MIFGQAKVVNLLISVVSKDSEGPTQFSLDIFWVMGPSSDMLRALHLPLIQKALCPSGIRWGEKSPKLKCLFFTCVVFPQQHGDYDLPNIPAHWFAGLRLMLIQFFALGITQIKKTYLRFGAIGAAFLGYGV